MSSPATNEQVQAWSDTRVRPRAEQIRALLANLQDDNNSIGSVYAACVEQSPTWTDQRTDGPPNLLATSDILNLNAISVALAHVLTGAGTTGDLAALTSGNLNLLDAACVRSIGT